MRGVGDVSECHVVGVWGVSEIVRRGVGVSVSVCGRGVGCE